jgi:hypothetical protein
MAMTMLSELVVVCVPCRVVCCGVAVTSWSRFVILAPQMAQYSGCPLLYNFALAIGLNGVLFTLSAFVLGIGSAGALDQSHLERGHRLAAIH